jgi:hypothetical protein
VRYADIDLRKAEKPPISLHVPEVAGTGQDGA